MKKNTKLILETLQNILTHEPNNPLLYLVHYGSKEPDKDIDLFAVYRYEPNHYECQVGKLDLFIVSVDQLNSMLKNYDTLVSEPLLTGTILTGDSHSWEKIKKSFLNSKPSLDSIYSLYSRALEMINSSFLFLQRYKVTVSPMDSYRFWKNISYAVGYISFGSLYSNQIFPLTCKQVMASCPDFDNAIKKFKIAKNSLNKPPFKEMQEAFKHTKKLFVMLFQK